jgi:hypothetical protein
MFRFSVIFALALAATTINGTTFTKQIAQNIPDYKMWLTR